MLPMNQKVNYPWWILLKEHYLWVTQNYRLWAVHKSTTCYVQNLMTMQQWHMLLTIGQYRTIVKANLVHHVVSKQVNHLSTKSCLVERNWYLKTCNNHLPQISKPENQTLWGSWTEQNSGKKEIKPGSLKNPESMIQEGFITPLEHILKCSTS